MKNLASSLSVAIQQRLTNPILGTYVLAWLATNIKSVILVFSLSGAERIEYLNALEFSWVSDFLIPSLITLFYLFAIPYLQLKVDALKYKLVDSKRIEQNNEQLEEQIESSATLNEKLSKSTETYWVKVQEKDLERQLEAAKMELTEWEKERDSLTKENATFESELDTHRVELEKNGELIAQLRDYQAQISIIMDGMKSSGDLSDLESDYYDCQVLRNYIKELSNFLPNDAFDRINEVTEMFAQNVMGNAEDLSNNSAYLSLCRRYPEEVIKLLNLIANPDLLASLSSEYKEEKSVFHNYQEINSLNMEAAEK